MPLYEYECAACGHVFEEICSAASGPPPCPACGSGDTARLVSLPGPLKTGAFPFKIGPVHPMAKKMAQGMRQNPCASCGGGNGCSN